MNKSELNQLSQPKLIIVRGPLGVGKTTISKLRADRIGAFYISIDKVLEDNKLDSIVEGESCISAENFLLANKVALPEIISHLMQEESVIVDVNFYHTEAIEDLLNKVGDFESDVFTLKASLDECVERDSKREKNYPLSEVSTVHGLVTKFDYGINIDVESISAEETIEAISKFL